MLESSPEKREKIEKQRQFIIIEKVSIENRRKYCNRTKLIL